MLHCFSLFPCLLFSTSRGPFSLKCFRWSQSYDARSEGGRGGGEFEVGGVMRVRPQTELGGIVCNA